MQPETQANIVKRLETVSCFNKVTRIVDALPSNGYIRNTLLNKHPNLQFADGVGIPIEQILLQAKLHHLSDILYLEVPNDYTWAQHEQIAKYLRDVYVGWVLYSPAHEQIAKHYQWARYEDGIFSNDVYKPRNVVVHKNPTGVHMAINICEYKMCERGSYNISYGKTEDSDSDDPHLIERTELLGKMAFAKMFGTRVDIQRRLSGQKAYFKVLGKLLEVQTVLPGEDKRLLIKIYVTDKDRENTTNELPIPCDWYVGCHIVSDRRADKVATVGFDGWTTRQELLRHPIITQVHDWWYRDFHFGNLRPMEELAGEFV